MKFYKDKSDLYFFKIKDNKLDAIYFDAYGIRFYKSGNWHNSKNASYISNTKYNPSYTGSKRFCLNDYDYGTENDFTKESWRRFAKLKVFL